MKQSTKEMFEETLQVYRSIKVGMSYLDIESLRLEYGVCYYMVSKYGIRFYEYARELIYDEMKSMPEVIGIYVAPTLYHIMQDFVYSLSEDVFNACVLPRIRLIEGILETK